MHIKNKAELLSYIQKINTKINCHAGNVRVTFPVLLGAVLMVMDADDNSLYVLVRGGDTKNVAWVKINGHTYYIRYEHANGGSIEVRRHTWTGETLFIFSDKITPPEGVINAIYSLKAISQQEQAA